MYHEQVVLLNCDHFDDSDEHRVLNNGDLSLAFFMALINKALELIRIKDVVYVVTKVHDARAVLLALLEYAPLTLVGTSQWNANPAIPFHVAHVESFGVPDVCLEPPKSPLSQSK